MSRKTALVYYVVFFLNTFVVSSLTDSCPKTRQCLDFRNEKDLSTKFQLLFTEEGVRIVYFKLNIAVSTYNSLDPDRILPTRWTWAQSNTEPLLSLSYDYDVLSLSLLTNQAKDLTLDFTDAQSQCIKALNSSCKDMEIARSLLDITNQIPNKVLRTKTDVVCFRVLRQHSFGLGSHFKYHCCKENTQDNGNGTILDCNVAVSESRWLAVFNAILAILVGVTFLFWPLMFYVLPNSFFTDESLCEIQDQSLTNNTQATDKTLSGNIPLPQLPLDDFSPVTLKEITLQTLGNLYPKNMLDLRVRLFLVWFGFIPIFFYIKLLLYFIIKSDHFDSTSKKLLFQVADFYFFVFNLKRPLVYVFFIVPFFIIPCVVIFLAQPRFINAIEVTSADNSAGNITESLKIVQEKCFQFMKKILTRVSRNGVFGDCTCMCMKKPIASFYSLAYFILIVPLCTVTTLVIVLFASLMCLIYFSPFFSLIRKILGSNIYSSHHRMANAFTLFLMIYSTLSASVVVVFSCQFAVRMLAFVIMGIILNAEFVVPYMTFAFVVANNIHLCFRNTQEKYKELKGIIGEKWQPECDTIPQNLFWHVSETVLPLFKEMCLLICKILAILVFLSVALAAILLFKLTYDASAIVPTISVFLSGKFSELFFTGITVVGWNKIRSDEEIKRAVQEYNQGGMPKKDNTSGMATTGV